MHTPLNLRCHSWISGSTALSWSYVTVRLCEAFERLGHNMYPISTNGIKNSDPYMTEQKMLESVLALQNFGTKTGRSIDIDWCYTVPSNFPKRFLPNSKKKCAIYNYETTLWPNSWKKYYHLVDCYFPSSDFSAEIFGPNTGTSIAKRKEAAAMSDKLADQGRNGDTMMVHASPFTMKLLQDIGGAGSFNPKTGMLEFYNLDEKVKGFMSKYK